MSIEAKTIVNEITSDYEAFLRVKNHLLSQKDKSIDSLRQGCSYKGYLERDVERVTYDVCNNLAAEIGEEYYELDGCEELELITEKLKNLVQAGEIVYGQCAVGCLIKDNFYSSEELEEKAVKDDSVLTALKKSNPTWKIDYLSLNLLENLQRLHDSMNIVDWRKYLDKIESLFKGNSKIESDFDLLNGEW